MCLCIAPFLGVHRLLSSPISKKPLETRMGKGKGNPETWVAVVKPGRVIFEVSGCTEQTAREGFQRAAQKLCVPCRMLSRY